jgi:hypothetical protein
VPITPALRISLPLFHGTRRVLDELSVSMSTSSSMKGDRFCALRSGRSSTLTRHSAFRLVAGGSQTRIGHRGGFGQLGTGLDIAVASL